MASRSIDDRWFIVDRMTGEKIPTPRRGKGLRYRARYRDAHGVMHYRSFADKHKMDAVAWLDGQVAALIRNEHVDPKQAKITVGQWCDVWLEGYGTNRPSTVRQARVHIKLIKAAFGTTRVADVKPSDVKRWTTRLAGDYAPSTVYATYRRFAQVMGDAVEDGIIPRSPCSRKTSPGSAKQRPYVATTEQVWALHDAMPEHLRISVLLGAFVGLRVAEAAALRVSDVDFMRAVVKPAIQYPAQPLKTETSKSPIPIPNELALMLAANVRQYGGETVVTNETGRASSPWAIERAIRSSRGQVPGLPEGFRFHDLRHYLASLLIGKGCDVKVVQSRLRHANATTTLNTYGHLWPDNDESTRNAITSALRCVPVVSQNGP